MWFLIRKNGGEVDNQSEDIANPWGLVDTDFWLTLQDPPLDSGINLDLQKIWTGTQIQNATPAEISAFPGFEQEDENLITRKEAKNIVNNTGLLGKVIKAKALVDLDYYNALVSGAATTKTKQDYFTDIIAKLDLGLAD